MARILPIGARLSAVDGTPPSADAAPRTSQHTGGAVIKVLRVAGIAAVILAAKPAWSVTCQGVPKPTHLETYQRDWICTGDGWIE